MSANKGREYYLWPLIHLRRLATSQCVNTKFNLKIKLETSMNASLNTKNCYSYICTIKANKTI